MKRILSLLIAVVMLVSSVSVASATQTTETEISDNQPQVVTETEAATQEGSQPTVSETLAENETQTQTEPEPTEAPVIDYPIITKFDTANGGTKIFWDAYEGAYRYRLFIKREDGSGWKALTTTTALSYTHTGLESNKDYTYTVRVVNADGSFGSEYYKNGWTRKYLDAPKLESLASVEKGQKLTWSFVEGATNYKVYIREGNAWKALCYTTGTSFVNVNAKSGESYRYTVRCVTDEGDDFTSHFDPNGITATFVATPKITKVENVSNGAKVTWNKVDGAALYKLFYKLEDGSGWKTIATTSADNATHTNIKSGDEYRYTVRACNYAGSYISAYDKTGVKNVFLSVPEITSVNSAMGGLEIKWNAVVGAENYKIYVKTAGSWKGLGFTTETSYIDTTAQSGTLYTYTVRCVSADGEELRSYFNTSGVSGSFIDTPLITDVENLENSVKVTWNMVNGVSKYKLFYKREDGSGWKTIGTTTSDNFVHEGLSDGDVYTYTVRGCDSKGNYISGYDKTGVTNVFRSPMQFRCVKVNDKSAYLSWSKVDAAKYYKVYRKNFGGEWQLIKTVTHSSVIDYGVIKNVPYTYTIRCFDENMKSLSAYSIDVKYYYNGVPADGAIDVNGTTYNFVNGGIKQGYVTINGVLYYYNENGTLEKNGIVGSDKDGYCLADSTGKIDLSVRKAYTYKGVDYNILDGKAYKVVTNPDRTLFRAFKELDKALKGKDASKLTDAQKLKICFDYVKGAYVEKNPRIPHYNGMDWPQLYANDMFVNGVGNCFSYGAAFAYMAKAIGYEEVYCCHSGGHGWAEIDGLVYDPEWSRHHFTYSYYALSYDSKTDQNYKGAIAPGLPWMHVKI